MSIEEIAFRNLQKDMPDLRKSGLRKTLREALRWLCDNNLNCKDYWGDWRDMLENMKISFVPDATKWRKVITPHGDITVVIELWEIEDTSKITKDKFDCIQMFALNWDNYAAIDPSFELWVTDRWGNNRFCAFSSAKEIHNIELLSI
jgi:hypothetical protein